ncbi:MAG: hypothetical protein AB4050_12190 [Synechococcus sp.]
MKIQQWVIGTGMATVLLGSAIGLTAQGEPGAQHSHSHDEMAHDEMAHDEGHTHKQLEVSADLPVPAVAVVVHEDAVNGWNLELQLDNFEFSPATINEPGAQNEGHAHLYINGEKVTRLYSNWYYLEDLEAGENTILVTLNTNTHEDLTVNGEVISASTIVSVL